MTASACRATIVSSRRRTPVTSLENETLLLFPRELAPALRCRCRNLLFKGKANRVYASASKTSLQHQR